MSSWIIFWIIIAIFVLGIFVLWFVEEKKEQEKISPNAECCANCKFYFDGECRVRAPQNTTTGNRYFLRSTTSFPKVRFDEWCGEFIKK